MAECVLCGKSRTDRQLSRHRNEQLETNYGFCKSCLKDKVNDEDMIGVIDMLRLMNVPFVSFVWENAVEKGGSSIFMKYLQLIATQKKYEDFSDSVYGDEDDGSLETGTASMDTFVVTDEMISRWGIKEDKEEYAELEAKLSALRKIKEPSTTLELQRYVQNVKFGKTLDNAFDIGDSKQIPGLSKAYAAELKELGLNIDMSGQEEGQSLGMRIREWEMREPVPEPNEFSDVDKIEKYIRKWFVIPMKRVFGQATEDEINMLYETEGGVDVTEKE